MGIKEKMRKLFKNSHKSVILLDGKRGVWLYFSVDRKSHQRSVGWEEKGYL